MHTKYNHIVLTWIQIILVLSATPPSLSLCVFELAKPSEPPPVMHLNDYLDGYNGARAN